MMKIALTAFLAASSWLQLSCALPNAAADAGLLRARDSTVCGSRGYNTKGSFSQTADATKDTCSTACSKQSKCKSFAVGGGKCYLFDVTATGNFKADSSSPYLLYDLSCVKTSGTTTTTTKSTTTMKSSTTTSVAAVCGVRGYDGGYDRYQESFDGTLNDCAASCGREALCQSFSYAPGECYLYEVKVTGNFGDDSTSPYMFYDVSCIKSRGMTTTSSAPKTTTSAAQVCGGRGYDGGYDRYQESTDGTYAGCSAACGREALCLSFAFASGECYLYEVKVAGNFEEDSTSPYLFYDLSCTKSSKPVTTTTTTKKTTTTSTTTRTTTKTTTTTTSRTTTKTTTTRPTTTTTTTSRR